MRPRNAKKPQRFFCQPHNKFDNLKEMNKFWDKYILLILKQEETKLVQTMSRNIGSETEISHS